MARDLTSIQIDLEVIVLPRIHGLETVQLSLLTCIARHSDGCRVVKLILDCGACNDYWGSRGPKAERPLEMWLGSSAAAQILWRRSYPASIFVFQLTAIGYSYYPVKSYLEVNRASMIHTYAALIATRLALIN